jgi:nucleoid-associated protein YgaU
MIDETLKMLIIGFNNPEFTIPSPVPPFKAHVNPTSYTQSVQVSYSGKQAPGTSGAASNYDHTAPKTLSFDFLLDRTGALGNIGTGDIGVTPDIIHFKKLTLNYEGEIHRPRYLKLIWGTLIFDCQLKSLDIEHKMFSPQGLPLRAILKTKFVEFTENTKRNALENKSSPDLTHVRIVKEGDTLPLLTHRIYGDSKYYLEVARINGLTNFRRLEPGTELMFPPIEKVT